MTVFSHERYEAQTPLGQGATATVWQVLDRRDGVIRAMKVLDAAAAPEVRLAFRAEFQTMRRLAHPRLAAAHAFGTLADGRAFFTLDLVPGPGLDALLPLPADRVRPLLSDALEGLAAMHARGTLHGDLKPENLRLDAEGRLVLVDFGLAAPIGERAPGVQGTPRYLAPEVIRGERLDGRSDLYALGAVFYHAVTGRPPFPGDEPRALLEAILTAPVAPLEAPGLDPELAATIQRLMARPRHERPAGALELLEALGAAPTGLDATLPAPAFVGRAALLASAREALTAAPALLTVTGPEGSGKTRFLEELAAAAQLEGHAVWSGSADGASGQPYGALDDLAAWLLARVPAAAAAFTQARTQAAALTPRGARAALTAAWLDLLVAQGAQPVIVTLDDWDRADAPSRALLMALAAAPGSPLVAFAAESGDRDLALPDLDPEAVTALAASRLGTEVPARLAAELHRLTGGLPGLVNATLEHLASTGALPREAGRWRPDRVALDALSLPPVATDAADRLAALPAPTRRLAGVLALARRPVTVAEAGTWLGLSDDDLAQAVEGLAAEGWLAEVATRPRLATPGLAAALREALPAEEARALHHAIAQGMHSPADAAARAWHWHGAGAPEMAAPDAIMGIRQRLAALDLAEAGRLVQLALSLPIALQATQELAGDLARMENRADVALAAYEVAIARAPEGAERARLTISAALALQLAGKLEDATARATEGAALAQAAGATSEVARAQTTLARLHHFAGRPAEAAAACEVARTAAREAGEAELEAEALGLLGFLRSREPGRSGEGLALLEQSIAIREGRGDRLALVDAHLTHGNALVAAGQYPKAAEAFAQALAIGRASGGAGDDEATTLINVGQVAIELGRLEEARAALDEAVRLAARFDNAFLSAYARGLRARALVGLGRVAEALDEAEAAVEAGRTIGSTYLEASARAWQSAVRLQAGDAGGALDTALEGRALAAPLGDPELSAGFALAAAEALVALGSGASALRHLEGLHRDVPSVAARAGAIEAEAALLREDFPTAAQATEAADRAAAQAGLAPVALRLALLEGRQAAVAGRAREAAQQFRRALQGATDRGLALLAADATRWLATVDEAPETQRLAEASRHELAAIAASLPAEARVAFARRWLPAAAEAPVAKASGDIEALSVISDFGRMVTGTLHYEEVLDRVIDQAMALAGADRGMVMLVDPDGAMTGMVVRPREAAGQAGLMAFSGTFVKAALEARQPIWITDAQGDARFSSSASVMALDLRTVLCVPLIVEGEVIGLLYVDRQSVNRTFTEADLRLVEGLAGFAALSIVNARRYAEARQNADELAAAQALGSLAGGRRSLGQVLEAMASGVAAVLPAERLVVLLGDDPYPTFAIDAAGVPMDPQVSMAIVDRVTASREAIVERDPDDPVAGAARQVLAAPLVVGDELLGALYLVRPEDTRPFTPREVGLLETLAGHAAPALDAVATREGLSRHVERLEGMISSMQARLIDQSEADDTDFGDL